MLVRGFTEKLKSWFKRKQKMRSPRVYKEGRRVEESTVYIISSSIILAGILVSATIYFFGIKIMRGIEELKYRYDPNNPLSLGSLIYYAYDLGIDTSWFKSCVTSNKYDTSIKNDQSDGENAGVQGTPTVYVGEFIDSQKMRGFQVASSYGTIDYAVNAVKDKGVELAAKDVREYIYQSIYSQAFAYYKSQQNMTEEEAKAQADKDASDRANLSLSIKEIGLGTLSGLKSGNPKVVILEFTDFECPYSKNLAQNTTPQIKDNLVNKGVAAYYIRMFPLESIHKNAKNGARAAFCANEKGKFWEMHDWMFSVGK